MNRDIAIVADDWLLREDLQIHENTLGNLHDWSHAGRLGNSLTINGRFLPKIKIPHSGPTRLRVINAANARPFVFKIKGDAEIKIIAVDGSPCSHFVPEKITVGPGQRVDLFTEDCSKLEELQEVSTGEAYVAANFIRGPTNADNRKWSHSETPYYSFPKHKRCQAQLDPHARGSNVTPRKCRIRWANHSIAGISNEGVQTLGF